MRHMMVDLETVGTGPDAAILSIGACYFSMPRVAEDGFVDAGKVGPTFYMNVDLQSSIDAGMSIDGGTFYWWMEKSEAARKALLTNRKPLKDALYAFARFFEGCNANEFPVISTLPEEWTGGANLLWALGTHFDVAILATAYRALKLRHPWFYRSPNDIRAHCRALGAFDEEKGRPITKATIPTGVEHDALSDAIFQAEAIIEVQHDHIKKVYDAALQYRKAAGYEDPADAIHEAHANGSCNCKGAVHSTDCMSLRRVPRFEPCLGNEFPKVG